MPASRFSREGVFVSYARDDGEAVARSLHDRLVAEAPDIAVWIDRQELEGGVGWWNQIEQQLDRVEFLLLVMSPAAMRSENTRREWRAARQRGVCVYPVKGGADSGLDYESLPRWMRKSHFYDPQVEWAKLLAHLRRGCRATRVPFMAPPLPPAFVARPRETEALERLVLAEDAAARPTVLRGPGGFGKTSLAAAFCHQDRVIEAFDDGILWVTLGQSPNLLAELLKLHGALTGERPGFVDVEDAARELAQRLAGKNSLIVIDDAWSVAHLRPFLIGAGPCHLITTRVFEVAMGTRRIDVGRMNPDEALHLLLARADVAPDDVDPYRRLAKRLGDWPLALKLAGSAIRQRVARGDLPGRALQYVERGIDKHGVGAVDRGDAIEPGHAIESTFAPSLALLDAEAQRRYVELCVFPEDEAVPMATVAALWQLDDLDAEELARRLDDLALAEFDLRRGTLRLHDVLRSLMLRRLPDASPVHARLVAAWTPSPQPGDAYAWRNVAYHLQGAGRRDSLRARLLSPDWLAAKLSATDVYSVISDFECFAEDPPMMLVRDALRLSAAALLADPRQLATQLLVRLMTRSEPDVVTLLEVLRARSEGLLLLTLHPTLDLPGGMLAMMLVGHQRGVTALAWTGDAATLLSASDDGSVRRWTAAGLALDTIHVHALGARSIAVDRLGNSAVCGGADGRLHVLDLASGTVVARFSEEPRRAVNAVAVSADGRIAVSGGPTAELRVWDVPARRMLARLVGHEDRINALAMSADGRTAVSASDDGSVRVWDVATASLRRTLRGHTGPVSCIAMSADGSIAISGSSDRTLLVWELDSGVCLQRLLGHEAAVTAVDLSDDGQRAASGSSNRMLNLWQVGQGRLLRQLVAHGDAVNAVRFGGPAGSAASASADRTIKLWRLDDAGTAPQRESHEGAVSALAFSPDGRTCVSGGTEGRIKLWDVASGRCTGTLGTPSTPVQSLAFTPDGSCVVTGNAGGQYRLWFVDTGESVWIPVRHHAPVDYGAFSHNTRHLLTSCSDRFVYLWDLSSGTLIDRYGTRRLFDHLIKPSPRRSSGAPGAELLDTYLPGEPVYQVVGLALDPIGRFAAISAIPVHAGSMRTAGPADREQELACILVLDVETGGLSTVATGQATAIRSFGVDAGGRYVVWAAPDDSLKLWDCSAGRQTAEFAGHRDHVQAVAIAAGRGLVVSCSVDRSVRVWCFASGAAVASLIGDSPMRSLRVAPDESLVAVGDASGRVHLLQLG